MTYLDRSNFTDFIINMCSKWSDARALGSKITNEDFKDIIILSLPKSWTSATAPLYNPNMTSADAIARLQIWHTKSHKNQLIHSSRNTIALQTSIPRQGQRFQLICTNPNCWHHGHTIEMCYWPGGGKEGQFPLGFGKRGGFRGSAANTRQGGFKPQSTINTTSTNEENDQVFACMTVGDSEFKVATSSNLNGNHSPDHTPSSSSVYNQSIHNTERGIDQRDISGELPLVCYTHTINKANTPTLLDSGASDHCFTNILLFTSYNPFKQPMPGLTAEEGLTFNIVGKGSVKLQAIVNGKRETITFDDALYTPGFRSNLISMARLSIKGAEAHFRDNKIIIRAKDRTDIMMATCSRLLYVVKVDDIQPTAFTTQLKQKPTTFPTWHRWLAHAGTKTIHQMITGNLVDGLNIHGEASIEGLCKDCVYGKHTARPYNENKTKEKKTLEHVYINIWGPSQVQLASGALYFMIIMDSFSSY